MGKKSKQPTPSAHQSSGGGKQKEDGLVVEGVVVEAVKGSFRVQMCEAGKQPDPKAHILMAHLAGKMRKNNIKIVQGDRVQVEVSPYDLTRGRIVYRMRH